MSCTKCHRKFGVQPIPLVAEKKMNFVVGKTSFALGYYYQCRFQGCRERYCYQSPMKKEDCASKMLDKDGLKPEWNDLVNRVTDYFCEKHAPQLDQVEYPMEICVPLLTDEEEAFLTKQFDEQWWCKMSSQIKSVIYSCLLSTFFLKKKGLTTKQACTRLFRHQK